MSCSTFVFCFVECPMLWKQTGCKYKFMLTLRMHLCGCENVKLWPYIWTSKSKQITEQKQVFLFSIGIFNFSLLGVWISSMQENELMLWFLRSVNVWQWISELRTRTAELKSVSGLCPGSDMTRLSLKRRFPEDTMAYIRAFSCFCEDIYRMQKWDRAQEIKQLCVQQRESLFFLERPRNRQRSKLSRLNIQSCAKHA